MAIFSSDRVQRLVRLPEVWMTQTSSPAENNCFIVFEGEIPKLGFPDEREPIGKAIDENCGKIVQHIKYTKAEDVVVELANNSDKCEIEIVMKKKKNGKEVARQTLPPGKSEDVKGFKVREISIKCLSGTGKCKGNYTITTK